MNYYIEPLHNGLVNAKHPLLLQEGELQAAAGLIYLPNSFAPAIAPLISATIVTTSTALTAAVGSSPTMRLTGAAQAALEPPFGQNASAYNYVIVLQNHAQVTSTATAGNALLQPTYCYFLLDRLSALTATAQTTPCLGDIHSVSSVAAGSQTITSQGIGAVPLDTKAVVYDGLSTNRIFRRDGFMRAHGMEPVSIAPSAITTVGVANVTATGVYDYWFVPIYRSSGAYASANVSDFVEGAYAAANPATANITATATQAVKLTIKRDSIPGTATHLKVYRSETPREDLRVPVFPDGVAISEFEIGETVEIDTTTIPGPPADIEFIDQVVTSTAEFYATTGTILQRTVGFGSYTGAITAVTGAGTASYIDIVNPILAPAPNRRHYIATILLKEFPTATGFINGWNVHITASTPTAVGGNWVEFMAWAGYANNTDPTGRTFDMEAYGWPRNGMDALEVSQRAFYDRTIPYAVKSGFLQTATAEFIIGEGYWPNLLIPTQAGSPNAGKYSTWDRTRMSSYGFTIGIDVGINQAQTLRIHDIKIVAKTGTTPDIIASKELYYPYIEVGDPNNDAATVTAARDFPPPVAKLALLYKDRLLIVPKDNPNVIRYSPVGYHESFPELYYIPIRSEHVDGIRGLEEVNGKVIFVTDSAGWRLEYLPTENDATFDRENAATLISTRLGALDYRSVCRYATPDGKQEVAVANLNAIYSTDGYSVTNLTPDLSFGSYTPKLLRDDPDTQCLVLIMTNGAMFYGSYAPGHRRPGGGLKWTGPIRAIPDQSYTAGLIQDVTNVRHTNGQTRMLITPVHSAATAHDGYALYITDYTQAAYRNATATRPTSEINAITRPLALGGEDDSFRLESFGVLGDTRGTGVNVSAFPSEINRYLSEVLTATIPSPTGSYVYDVKGTMLGHAHRMTFSVNPDSAPTYSWRPVGFKIGHTPLGTDKGKL
jgi:hypothetical protein